MYHPPSTNAGDGRAKQPKNERPVEDVGERRHRNEETVFPGLRLQWVRCTDRKVRLVFVWSLQTDASRSIGSICEWGVVIARDSSK